MSGVLIRITPEQIEALGVVLDTAHEETENYVSSGDARCDHGGDYPAFANRQATQFRALAEVAGALIAGERERWEALANAMVADAVEYSLAQDAARDRRMRAKNKA